MSHTTNLRLLGCCRPCFHDPLFIAAIVGPHCSLVLFYLVQPCHHLVLRSLAHAVVNFARHWHDDGIWSAFQHHWLSFCTDQPRSVAGFPFLLHAVLRIEFLIHREGTWVHVHFFSGVQADRYRCHDVRYILRAGGLSEGDEERDIMKHQIPRDAVLQAMALVLQSLFLLVL